MTKKTLFKEVSSLSIDYTKVVDIIEQLKDIVKEHGTECEIRMCPEPYSDSDKAYPYVFASRLETDKEYASRLAKESLLVKNNEERERKLLKELQKKYGK